MKTFTSHLIICVFFYFFKKLFLPDGLIAQREFPTTFVAFFIFIACRRRSFGIYSLYLHRCFKVQDSETVIHHNIINE